MNLIIQLLFFCQNERILSRCAGTKHDSQGRPQTRNEQVSGLRREFPNNARKFPKGPEIFPGRVSCLYQVVVLFIRRFRKMLLYLGLQTSAVNNTKVNLN